MTGRPEDWDELFLRYLEGLADPELERRVRERLVSDESARNRMVTLACQQQALADVLGETSARKPSSRRMVLPPPARRSGVGFFLAAAAAAAIAIGVFLLSPSESEQPLRRPGAPASAPEARTPEKAAPLEESKKPLVQEEKPQPRVPVVSEPEKKEPVAPVPKPAEKVPEGPKQEEPKPAALEPRPENPTRVTETVVATLEHGEGEVWIVADGRRSKAEAKQTVKSGQGLETAGPAAAAEISYADGTRVKLGPDTVVRGFLEPKGRSGKRLSLAQGVLAADVRKQPGDQPMVISTPQGEATVVGTKLRLRVDPGEKGSTRLEVEEGKVRLKRFLDNKTIDVATGTFAVAGATPGEFKPLPSILSGLVGYWRFEDPVGAAMTDSSGLGHHGTLVGKARRTLGRIGQGLELDGATASVQVPHAAALDPGPSNFSLSVWLRNRKQDVWGWNVLFKDNGKFQSYYYLSVTAKPRFEFSTGDAKVTIDGEAGINDNRWHHVVAVRNGPYSAQLYVDGVLDSSASAATSSSSSVRTSTPLIIGSGNAVGNQSFYAGQLDEVRVYNRALTADEVRQLYAGR